MADVVNQGMSFVENEDKLGNDRKDPLKLDRLTGGLMDGRGDLASWMDHARDWLYIVNMLRAEMPRPIVAIGHSMGGVSM